MKILNSLKKYHGIISLFDKKGKRQYVLLLLIIIITAIFEMFGVGAISPLLSLAMDPDSITGSSKIVGFLSSFTGFSGTKLVLAFGVLFIIIILLKNVLGLFTFIRTSHFSSHLNKSFSIRLMKNYLSKDYSWFLKKNSADFPRLIIQETKILTRHIIHKSLIVFVNIFLILGMLILIAMQDFLVAIYSIGALGLIFGGLHLFVKVRLKALGKVRFVMDKHKFKIINDTFSGIKDVKVYGCENSYINNYYNLTNDFANNTVKIDIFSNLTKYLVETLFFSFFGILIIILVSKGEDISKLMPTLSLYLFAAYKIMPALQKVSAAINSIMSYVETFKKLKKDMDEDCEILDTSNIDKLNFSKSLIVNNVKFTYEGKDDPVIDGLEVKINCNEKIGIVGGSGSGKTTLLNLLLGLLKPDTGSILVDSAPLEEDNIIGWRKNIGLVSQDIFLFDGTIAENIAFTMDSETIDSDLLVESAKNAEMLDYINTLPMGFDTNVGDRGIQISGGQAQRIAIARALYRTPQLLVLDEATSAMDNLTESAIMDSIEKLTGKKTIIIVAHRLSTVKNCDRILFMKNGSICAQGTFEELKATNQDFKELTMEDMKEGHLE